MKKIDLTKSHDVFKAYQKTNFDSIRKKYPDAGTQYAFDILDQKITTGYHIQLACFRHLRDLQRQETGKFPYYYSTKQVHNILFFASLCPEIKSHKPVKLMPWQKFILAMLQGWRNHTNDKRFTWAIISVARHNGKTYLMAIITVYSFLIQAVKQNGQEFLISSVDAKQSRQLMKYVKRTLVELFSNGLFKDYNESVGISMKGLTSLSQHITMSSTDNEIIQVTFNSGTYDSHHFQTAIGDEFGSSTVKDQTKLNSITSGQGDVDNHQFIQISTAYDDPSVPFRQDEKRIYQAMEEDYKRDGDSYLLLDWSQDNVNETYKPDTWIKSNPLLGLKGGNVKLMDSLKDERDNSLITADVAGFQNKSLNMWLQQSKDTFINLADVEKSIVPNFDIDGRTVYVGFDYSMSSDNTSFAFVYPYVDDDGNNKWHIEQHSFIPWHAAGSIEAKEKQDGINYRELAKLGYCTITNHEQGLIDDDQIYRWLLDYVEDHNLKVIFFGYDAMGVTSFIKAMDNNTSFPLDAVRQRTSELKDPTKFLQRIFVEGSATRLDDRIMEKALLNATLKEDRIGIQVDKTKATLKIDVVDAIVDALYQGMYHFEDYGIENDKTEAVKRMTPEQVKARFDDPDAGLT
ncbi:terminase large subunit [Fructilactobacillus fructivorans]|uniref:Terminase large subunit n=1 Tax=Fructilactobacillus fructivorans TaxID=1614 RepID=A0AAE6TW27_9LACO|nr:terminase TerL endonuclease subunit [Fructilactobacillus fructivorans]KRK58495.1 phage terminase [Fructilactobacillus fructivorans]QFX92504.1 terminase large subunit [Fructilactobacillus fructivorans]RDV65901.1 terminase large subunit [Fructilactobacillus fructivorans]